MDIDGTGKGGSGNGHGGVGGGGNEYGPPSRSRSATTEMHIATPNIVHICLSTAERAPLERGRNKTREVDERNMG